MKPQTFKINDKRFTRYSRSITVECLGSHSVGKLTHWASEEITALYEFLNAPDVPEPPKWPEGVPAWAEFVTTQPNGSVVWWSDRPVQVSDGWVNNSYKGTVPAGYFEPFTGDWKDSLVKRPKDQTIDHLDGIAPGHNPDKLTNAQVGVVNGWRLLNADEVYEGKNPMLKEIQAWRKGSWDVGENYGASESLTYRTKLTPAQLSGRRSQLK